MDGHENTQRIQHETGHENTQRPIIPALPNGMEPEDYEANLIEHEAQLGIAQIEEALKDPESQALNALQYKIETEDDWSQGIDLNIGRALQVITELERAVIRLMDERIK